MDSTKSENANTEPDMMNAINEIIQGLDGDDAFKDEIRKMMRHLGSGGALADLHNLTETDLEIIYSMGLNFYNSAKYKEARTVFKFLCMMDHTGGKWWMGLGAAHQMLQDYQAAVDAYAYCTMLDMEDPEPQVQAAYCLLAQNDKPEAISALEGAILAAGNEPKYAAKKQQAQVLLSSITDKE